MIYKNYLKQLAKKANVILNDITASHNFENGPEYEIAICELLDQLLPDKYGVCRGFVVSHDNKEAGDDIIIYDQYRFPTLRLFDKPRFDKKQRVPIEAVYAYIEAKHSLRFSGENSTFHKALDQVNKVKELVETREEVTIKTSCDPYIENSFMKIISGREHWPSKMNPMFCAIFSPQIRDSKGKIIDSPDQIHKMVGDFSGEIWNSYSYKPDLIIGNPQTVSLPGVITEDDQGKHLKYHSPFITKDTELFTETVTEDYGGLATGLCSLLFALDVIRLGRMPWPKIISDFLEIEK